MNDGRGGLSGPHFLARISAVVLGGLAFTGCFSPDVAYDPDAPLQIECGGDEDCPNGWVCRSELRRCLPTSVLGDSEPPTVENAQVTPAAASIGATVYAYFDTTASLLRPPEVTLAIDGRPVAFGAVPDDSHQDEREHVFRYEITGSEPTGPHPVNVRLTNALGELAVVALGVVTLDFTPPALASASVEPAHATAGDIVAVEVTFTEPLSSPPSMDVMRGDIGSDLLLELAESSEDATRFRYTLAVDETDAEAVYTFIVQASDAAGNGLAPTLEQTLTIDRTAPALDGAAVITPGATVRPGDVLRVSVPLTEAPTGTPTLLADDTSLQFDRTTDAGALQVFTALVPADGPDDLVVALSLTDVEDAAGNDAGTLALGEVRIDGVAPAVEGWTQSTTAAQPGTPVDISFTTSEPTAEPCVLTFAGVDYAPTDVTATESFTFSVDVAATSAEGSFLIQVSCVDAAGNVGVTYPGSLLVDTAPPEVVAVTFTPDSVGLGGEAFATVTVSEPLGAPPVLAWSATTGGLGAGTYEGSSGFGHLFSWRIDESDPTGLLLLKSAEVEDVAGNRTTVDLAAALGQAPGLLVDNLAPIVTAPTPDAAGYSAAAGFDVVTVTFDVTDDEPIDGAPAVTLGGRAMSCGDYADTSPSFTCTYAVVGDEPEGPLPLLATIVDSAGNQGFATGSVVLDFTGPEVVPGSAFLIIVPGASNPSLSPSQATAGSTVRVGFRLDEAVDPTAGAVVRATSPATVDFTTTSLEGGDWLAQHVVQDGAGQGFWALEVEATDLFGNTLAAALPLPEPGLVVDTAPPAPPLADVADALRLRRTPWGSDETGGEVELRVEASAGAFPDGEEAVFWTAAAAPRAELGRATLRADGGLDATTLLPADTGTVYAVALDAAGNESPPARIRDVEWVATLGGKVSGSVAENPNRLTVRPFHTRHGAGVLDIEAAAPRDAATDDAATVLVRGAGRWRAPNLDAPFHADSTASAYDSSRGRLIFYGGLSNDQDVWTGATQDTWELVDERWLRIAPTDPEGDGDPNPLCDHAMTFDTRRGVAVMFGGMESCYYDNTVDDLWEYDGTSWRLVTPTDPEGDGNPARRFGSSLVFDEAREVVLLYGGEGPEADYADLWEYDGVSWRLLRDGTANLADGPGYRSYAPVAYDPVSESVILTAGYAAVNEDVWVWDGASWTSVTPVDDLADGTPTHTDLRGAAGGFDRDRGVWILVTGSVWEWDGAEWRDLGAPPPGVDAWMPPHAWHAARGELVTVQGRPVEYNYPATSDVGADVPWTFDGMTWGSLPLCCNNGQAGPPPRFETKITANPVEDYAILTGYSYEGVAEQTWRLEDGSFVELADPDDSGDGEPIGQNSWSAVWDENTQQILTFSRSTVWSFDGSEWHPSPITDPEADGPAVVGDVALIAWEPNNAQLMTFQQSTSGAGNPADLAWRWTGGSWESVPLTDPEGDGNPPLRSNYWFNIVVNGDWAHDPVSGDLLYFDQWYDTSGNVQPWRFTGSSWERLDVTDPEGDGNPEQRYYARVGVEPDTQHIVMHGGFAKEGVRNILGDMWRWTGTSWLEQRVADPSGDGGPGNNAVGTIGLTAEGQLAMYGGQNGTSSEHDGFWLWDSGVDGRPSVVFTAATGEAGVLPGSDLRSAEVRMVAGGFGDEGAQNGAELLAWQAGAWTAVGQNDAPIGAPAQIFSAFDTRTTRETVRTGLGQVSLLAVAPRGVNGAGFAEVELDAVELRVTYRLPPEGD